MRAVVDGGGLVDQQHGDPVAHLVAVDSPLPAREVRAVDEFDEAFCIPRREDAVRLLGRNLPDEDVLPADLAAVGLQLDRAAGGRRVGEVAVGRLRPLVVGLRGLAVGEVAGLAVGEEVLEWRVVDDVLAVEVHRHPFTDHPDAERVPLAEGPVHPLRWKLPLLALVVPEAARSLVGPEWKLLLLGEIPDLHLQSHVAENEDEIAWVKRLYPESRSYLQVYQDFGLLGPRATYAHCIWFDDEDRRLMAATQTAAAFCPTSNLFLGSGLFDLAAARSCGLAVGLATDVGGGTSFSMLRTMQEAYKVAQLKGLTMTAEECFYLATLGGARALGLDAMIGSFDLGKEADVVVINPQATAICSRRIQSAKTLSEQLFVTMMLGDERMIEQTHILGRPMQTSELKGAVRAD